jgi:hypothetical protein
MEKFLLFHGWFVVCSGGVKKRGKKGAKKGAKKAAKKK